MNTRTQQNMPQENILKETLTTALKTKKYSGFLQNLARKLVLAKLQSLQNGKLEIIEAFSPEHTNSLAKSLAKPLVFGHGDLSAKITVLDAHFYGEIAFGGTIGAAEAYMLGYWTTNNLTHVIRIMARSVATTDTLEGSLAILAKPLLKTLHWLNRNTEAGSRKNIAAHYDLGNPFFELMLDHTMMYSCGIFESANTTLEQASVKKLDVICKKLDLKSTDHVIEIGAGWGGFAIYAARNYGCKVTSTTISQAQFDLAQARVKAANLQDSITILLKDYRVLEGKFDKLVSIEMIEAVGYQFYDTYFEKCASLLKPNGLALIQAITIVDQRFEQAKKSVDFIQRYIFPGSCIPSNTAMQNSITRASDLRLLDLQDIGPHYAPTLAAWRHNFFEKIEQVRALGYSEAFIKMWEFYLCYCEGGFEERALGDVHLLLAKPDARRAVLP